MSAGDEGGNLNADDNPADAREIVQSLQGFFEDMYAKLVNCDMNADEANDRRLPQDPFQQADRIQNPQFIDGDEHGVGQGGGNNFNSEETSNVQGTSNQLAGSSTTSAILGPSISETRSVPVSPGEAVLSLSNPSSSNVTNGDTTASSSGRKPSFSMEVAARTAPDFVPQQQAMNQLYPQPNAPSWFYGNMVNSFYEPPWQNTFYPSQPPPPPSAFQQNWGCNSIMTYPYQNRNSNLPPPAVPIVPPAYVPAYLPAYVPAYVPAYPFDTLSDNAANSTFGYEDQIVNRNVWPVQGEHTYSVIPPHRNQHSPSFRHSRQQQQQEQQEQEQQPYGRSTPYNDETPNQQNSRRDPSDRT